MRCLYCPHLIIHDQSEYRLFACGHDVESELDENTGATVIGRVIYGGENSITTSSVLSVLFNKPVWCPLKPVESPT